MNSFFDSDLGKKLSTKQVSLAQKGMQFGQTWGMEVQQIAQKYQTGNTNVTLKKEPK